LPIQLPWCVRIGVDREEHARVDGLPQDAARRVQPLRAAVDLERDVVAVLRRVRQD
jgi:hypothetical protein